MGTSWGSEKRRIGRPSARRFFELAGDAGFVAEHGGREGTLRYLSDIADVLVDGGFMFETGGRAFRAAAALGDAGAWDLGGALPEEDARGLVHEARVLGPEEYCAVNGVAAFGDPEAAMERDLRRRAAEAAAGAPGGGPGRPGDPWRVYVEFGEVSEVPEGTVVAHSGKLESGEVEVVVATPDSRAAVCTIGPARWSNGGLTGAELEEARGFVARNSALILESASDDGAGEEGVPEGFWRDVLARWGRPPESPDDGEGKEAGR